MTELQRTVAVTVAVVVPCVLWMCWPLPMELGVAWTSARAEGDLAWSLVMHDWATDALTGQGQWTRDPRVWFPDGGALAASAWNLVALITTGWLGIGVESLAAWHRSMLFIGLCNGLAGGWLGWRVAGRPGAVLAAIACAASPLAWFEMCEGRLEQGLVAPLAVCAAEAWAWSRSPRPVLAGLALGLVAATYWFLGPVALVTFSVLPLLGPGRVPRPLRSELRALGVAAAVCLTVLVLALLPILDTAWSGAQQAAIGDGQLSRIQRVASAISPFQLVAGGRLPAHRIPLVAVLLLPVALKVRETRPWVIAMAIGTALAAGSVWSMDGTPVRFAGFEWSLPLRALDALPGFSRFWWPDRIVAVVLVATAGALAGLTTVLPPRWLWPGVAIVGGAWAVDARMQLRDAVDSGDPRIPTSELDPSPLGGFYTLPTLPETTSSGVLLVGPWSTTANLIPLLAIHTGRPLIRGDGAADARLWPQHFAERVHASPLLSALYRQAPLPPDTLEQLDELKITSVIWRGHHDDWTSLLGCAPVATGSWHVWDRERSDCR